MLKKMMAAVLAGVLALSLALPVYADKVTTSSLTASLTDPVGVDSSGLVSADVGKGEVTFKSDSVMNDPPLKFQIYGNAGLVLNPYGLTVTRDVFNGSLSGETTMTDGAGQVITSMLKIVNQTEVPLITSVTLIAEPKGPTVSGKEDKLVLQAKPSAIKDTDTGKKLFLALLASTTVGDVNKNGGWSKKNDTAHFETLISKSKKEGKILVATAAAKGVTAPKLLYINASDQTATNTGYFAFVGFMTESPDSAWSSADYVKTTLEFTFRKTSAAAYNAATTTPASS